MQICKWGNSLAIRLPSAVVEALELKDGDQIEVHITGSREFKIVRDDSQRQALEKLRSLKWKLPPGFVFDRDEVHER